MQEKDFGTKNLKDFIFAKFKLNFILLGKTIAAIVARNFLESSSWYLKLKLNLKSKTDNLSQTMGISGGLCLGGQAISFPIFL